MTKLLTDSYWSTDHLIYWSIKLPYDQATDRQLLINWSPDLLIDKSTLWPGYWQTATSQLITWSTDQYNYPMTQLLTESYWSTDHLIYWSIKLPYDQLLTDSYQSTDHLVYWWIKLPYDQATDWQLLINWSPDLLVNKTTLWPSHWQTPTNQLITWSTDQYNYPMTQLLTDSYQSSDHLIYWSI